MFMQRFYFTFLIFSCLLQGAYGQSKLLVLEASNPVLTIKDGEEWKRDYWTVSPEIPLDIYTVDKTRKTKTVTYYSDLESLTFQVGPEDSYDFAVIVNGKDTCYQRLESGIKRLQDNSLLLTSDTIPFSLTEGNNIVIKTIVNGVDSLNLMFHTAAGAIALIKDATAKMESLNLDRNVEGASGWGGGGTMRASTGNSVQIGDLNWRDLVIYEDDRSGRGTDGKFGPTLFNDKILELDFEKQRMIVHSRTPVIGGGYSRYDLIFKGSSMFLEGDFNIGPGQLLTEELLIHSGYSGTVLLNDDFVSEHRIGDKLETIKESELRDSFGNIVKTKKAILPYLSIGESTFSEMPIGFFEGSIGRQKMSVMGGDLIKRFNIIIDLQNAYIYLKPNSLMPLVFTDV